MNSCKSANKWPSPVAASPWFKAKDQLRGSCWNISSHWSQSCNTKAEFCILVWILQCLFFNGLILVWIHGSSAAKCECPAAVSMPIVGVLASYDGFMWVSCQFVSFRTWVFWHRALWLWVRCYWLWLFHHFSRLGQIAMFNCLDVMGLLPHGKRACKCPITFTLASICAFHFQYHLL